MNEKTFRCGQADKVGKIYLDLGARSVECDWRDALQMATVLRAQAQKAGELEAAGNGTLVMDSAILIRSGAPFGLTNNRPILKEATKEAFWNRLLRRAMPGGVKSQAVVGAPRLIQHPPKKG